MIVPLPKPELPITQALLREYREQHQLGDNSSAGQDFWDAFELWMQTHPDQELVARSKEEREDVIRQIVRMIEHKALGDPHDN